MVKECLDNTDFKRCLAENSYRLVYIVFGEMETGDLDFCKSNLELDGLTDDAKVEKIMKCCMEDSFEPW